MRGWCDRLIFYDDCSTDGTLEILRQADVGVIEGKVWYPDRQMEEMRPRQLLLQAARECGPDWVWCFDADERYEGTLRLCEGGGCNVRLFDAYLTRDCEPCTGSLSRLRRLFGPEYRDILMLFRPRCGNFTVPDAREPCVRGPVAFSGLRCRHFGKGISVEQWEANCDYYSAFPEPYKSKWTARRGKAIHTLSDFGRPLYEWGELPAHQVSLLD